MEFKSGYCKNCEESRKVERGSTNHVLHLILSIITAGLWLIVWLLISVKIGGWRCSTCGSNKVSKVN